MDVVEIVAARPEHMPKVQAIKAYYIVNTIVNFSYEVTTIESELETLHECNKLSLPYLVALRKQEGHENVLGFCAAHTYRGSKAGYHRTVELSIYCKESEKSKGVGTALMQRLVLEMQSSGKVKQVLAFIGTDPHVVMPPAVEKFYAKAGFIERGTLKNVGWKFDKWLDVKCLQLEIP